jgi:hypothetical protein
MAVGNAETRLALLCHWPFSGNPGRYTFGPQGSAIHYCGETAIDPEWGRSY